MLLKIHIKWLILVTSVLLLNTAYVTARNYTVDSSTPRLIDTMQFGQTIMGGDTIFLDASRTTSTIFNKLRGDSISPIVIINKGEIVTIDDKEYEQAIELRNCKYIKLSGTGSIGDRYGIKLSALNAGISISRLSTNIEIENIAIDHDGFFGITAKEDYHGNPPYPIPVFNTLIVHDCYITNVTEGFYIGETKTPGMKFIHVKLYNNIIYNTGREAMQIANATEDVEIYNNLMYISGTDNGTSQSNNLQIGDNSVAEIYNNIIIGAPDYGIISFGLGNVNIYSNYIEDNKGIFIDHRTVTDLNATVEISDNFISNTNYESVIKNLNALNQLNAYNNTYDTDINFIETNSESASLSLSYNNAKNQIEAINFDITDDGEFILSTDNPEQYKLFGPTQKTDYNKSYWPVFAEIEDIYIDANQAITKQVYVSTTNLNAIGITYDNLPSFITTTQNEKGEIILDIHPEANIKGIYKVTIIAKEKSKNIITTKDVNIIVKNGVNNSPNIIANNSYSFNALTSNELKFTVNDRDNDEISVTISELPLFIRMNKVAENSYKFKVNPDYVNAGTYNIKITATDDYQGVTEKNISIDINANMSESGLTIYRINYGGPTITSSENKWNGIETNSVTYNAPKVGSTGSYTWSGTNTTSAPNNVFGPCIYSKSEAEPLALSFKCTPAKYQVKLFFTDKEAYVTQFGSTIMNIYAEDSLIEANYNISKPDFNAIEKTFYVTVKDSLLELDLESVTNKAKIFGIEISVADEESENTKTAKISVYPNPFISTINLVNDQQNPIQRVEIFRLTGNKIYGRNINSAEINQVSLNTSFMSSGSYLIKIQTENLTTTQIIHKD